MRMRAPDYVRSGTGQRAARRATHGLLVRAYVLDVYAADDPSAANGPVKNGQPEDIGSVLCEVMVIEPGYRGRLTNVPVLSSAGGLNSVAHWHPTKATTMASTGTPAVGLSDLGNILTTDPGDTDGDLVIVGFLGNDLARPVIVGSLMKPNSNHAVKVTNAGSYAWFHAAAGSVVGVEAGGRVVIDTSSQPLQLIPGADEVVIKTGGTGGLDGTTITVSGADVTINTGLTGKVSIDGNAIGMALGKQPVVLSGALTDLLTIVLEWYPVVTAIAGLFGIPLVNTPVIIAALSAGVTTSGNGATSHSLETD
tara:strand:- start:1323 stop:2249 length:927 start_codon:yes stop_codon:yes gene_type:complete